MPRIIRQAVFAWEVDDDHPAVTAAREGLPVRNGTLPTALLGCEPSAVTYTDWFVDDAGVPTQIYPC